jgi:hypothetical protein
MGLSTGKIVVQAPQSPPASTERTQFAARTESERRDILGQLILEHVKHGWRVESQSDYQAVFVRGKRPNHLLHLILSIVTLGLWIPVWILLSLVSHVRHKVVTVGEYPDVKH